MQPITLFTHPSRATALAQLNAFVPHAGQHYEARRNNDLGPADRSNVSMLSPFIRHRLITEHEVLATVLGRHSIVAAEKFVQELFWRTYFKGHLETRPFIWTNYRATCQTHIDGLGQKGGLRKAYKRAVEGKTGIECFDAWVEELQETGYLHNHTRMWFASIWIFTLRLPWELGADFMYRHLLDGDAASNTLSWRWVGGLHTKGKTYLARADNIRSCTQGRFNPDGLAHTAPPLEEATMPPAIRLRDVASAWPSGKIGLLLTEEDLHPELPEPGICDITAIAGATVTSERSTLEISPLVEAFVNDAMADALTHTAHKLAVNSTVLPSLSALAIEDWARANTLTTVVTPYAPVGPVTEQLPAIAARLAGKGIRLLEIRRGFDTRAWPHATRGFFGLKEKIPKLLDAMGIIDGKGDPQLPLFENAKK
jgi:deoxyribodipyrimidine photo-lyase